MNITCDANALELGKYIIESIVCLGALFITLRYWKK